MEAPTGCGVRETPLANCNMAGMIFLNISGQAGRDPMFVARSRCSARLTVVTYSPTEQICNQKATSSAGRRVGGKRALSTCTKEGSINTLLRVDSPRVYNAFSADA